MCKHNSNLKHLKTCLGWLADSFNVPRLCGIFRYRHALELLQRRTQRNLQPSMYLCMSICWCICHMIVICELIHALCENELYLLMCAHACVWSPLDDNFILSCNSDSMRARHDWFSNVGPHSMKLSRPWDDHRHGRSAKPETQLNPPCNLDYNIDQHWLYSRPCAIAVIRSL